jgi:hypothetical protein
VPDHSDERPVTAAKVSRRLLLGGIGAAGVAVGAGGVAGVFELTGSSAAAKDTVASASASAATAPPTQPAAMVFRPRPDLSPPRVQMTLVGVPPTDSFLVTPNFGPGGIGASQQGLMILDGRGALVWFEPKDPAFTNLQVQTYQGRRVLTWWQGAFDPAGFGRGTGYIADGSYRVIATVNAANGAATDLHELVLTTAGTALITAYVPSTADLGALGGPSGGAVYAGVVQEIDVATGALIFEWSSIDHVPVLETYAALGDGPLDYFHINSIAVDPADGNLLVSARNTWAVYKLDRSTGEVLWRLGGKRSDFTIGPGTTFAWQHDARARGDGMMTLFDDGATPVVEAQSRALELAVDEGARTVSLTRAFTHPARLLAANQGNVQLLSDGSALVGWGSEPYFSHFGATGTLLRDARMPTGVQSYRAFREHWSGSPATVPDIAIEGDVTAATVYVSWNGATGIGSWQVLSGASPDSLSDSGSVPKGGFETAITVRPTGPWVAVRAIDPHGTAMATSKAVRLPGA